MAEAVGQRVPLLLSSAHSPDAGARRAGFGDFGLHGQARAVPFRREGAVLEERGTTVVGSATRRGEQSLGNYLMVKHDKRLGKGLSSLISRETVETALTTALEADERADPPLAGRQGLEAVLLRPQALEPNPFQPRKDMDADGIASLAESLKQSGMLQPIVARRAGTRLEIIAGERRWRAARQAGLDLVPVLIRPATDEQMVEMALVENVQRSDLNPIEKARAYRRLCDEFSLSPEEVGRRVGEDRSTVTNYLRLLDLPGEIAAMVSRGDISMGHARCLLAVDAPDRQMQLARSVAKNELSVRALEEVVRRTRTERAAAPDAPAGRVKEKSAHVADLEGQFQRALGLKVRIEERRGKGRGRIIIDYNNLDEFDRVAAALGVQWE